MASAMWESPFIQGIIAQNGKMLQKANPVTFKNGKDSQNRSFNQ
jgi:hypothetical protein